MFQSTEGVRKPYLALNHLDSCKDNHQGPFAQSKQLQGNTNNQANNLTSSQVKRVSHLSRDFKGPITQGKTMTLNSTVASGIQSFTQSLQQQNQNATATLPATNQTTVNNLSLSKPVQLKEFGATASGQGFTGGVLKAHQTKNVTSSTNINKGSNSNGYNPIGLSSATKQGTTNLLLTSDKKGGLGNALLNSVQGSKLASAQKEVQGKDGMLGSLPGTSRFLGLGGQSGLNSGTVSTAQKQPAASNQVLIHVCDEAKKKTQDFKCDKNLLLKYMKYFEKYLCDQ